MDSGCGVPFFWPCRYTGRVRLTRRNALVGAVAAAAGLLSSAANARFFFRDNRLPIGINLYMLEDQYAADLNGTLEAVAKIGYREVETSFDTYPAKQIRDALIRTGLSCPNIGILPLGLRGGLSLQSDPAAVAAAVHSVGAEYLTLTLFPLPPGVEMRPRTGESVAQMLARVAMSIKTDDWKRAADFLNAKGAQFARQGIKLAYHNHNPEFVPHGETNGLAILLEHTDPRLVSFEMDAGWVVAAGHDPVVLLRAYPGRFRLMHVKDIAPTHQTNTVFKADTVEVGAGIIDWKRVLTAALASGVRHFAVEQEPPYTIPRIEAARRAFAYLNTLQI
jgi:sugar phosphate isomerase/epimerase